MSSAEPSLHAPRPGRPGEDDDHVKYVQGCDRVIEARAVDVATLDSRTCREECTSMPSLLQILGVDLAGAARFVNTIRRSPQASVMEMYGRGRMAVAAHGRRRNLNFRGLGALDLSTCKADGSPEGVRLASYRKLAVDMVTTLQPQWVVGSPPRTAFCNWNHFLNNKREPKAQVADMMRDAGLTHVGFNNLMGGAAAIHFGEAPLIQAEPAPESPSDLYPDRQ